MSKYTKLTTMCKIIEDIPKNGQKKLKMIPCSCFLNSDSRQRTLNITHTYFSQTEITLSIEQDNGIALVNYFNTFFRQINSYCIHRSLRIPNHDLFLE